jgi:TolB-like protein/Tfp pilus assembly protein PilF
VVRPDSALLAIAESVADGRAVDWAAVEAAATPDDRSVVRQLRVLAELSTLHRTLIDDPMPRSAPGPALVETAPAIGRWAHLDLLARIGGGSFGEVYRAWDRHLQRQVALKLLRTVERGADPFASRIVEEGRLLASVRHPNIVAVHGVAERDGRVGLWMELVEGVTLEDAIAAHGPLSAAEAAVVGIDLCRALAAVHRAGLVHRDVKTQNVMRERGGRIVLMDLGAGRRTDRATNGSDRAGTPLSIAPELFEGAPASARSDVYSLGVLLYRLVTGEFPVRAASLDELEAAHRAHRVVRLRDARPDLPAAFVRVIDRAIAADPAERYGTAGALEADLARTQRDEIPPESAVRARSSRRQTLTVIAAILALAAAVLAGARLRSGANASAGPVRSLVVLPLVNLSGDPAQEYFADGMTEQLIGAIGEQADVRVISRTSAMRFKGTGQTVPEIARTLHVDAVLEGTVLVPTANGGPADRRRIRITARLIRAGTDTQLWERTFEAVADDVLALQTRISTAVAEGIHARLTAHGTTPQAVTDFEAFDLYLRGRAAWNLRTADGMKRSIGYFEQAIARDDSFALGYAGLADAYGMLGVYGYLPRDDSAARAASAAERALALDPSLAEAHAALASVSADRFAWTDAEQHYMQALALNPAYATAHHWYATLLAQRGRLDEARREIAVASSLDPMSPSVDAEYGAILIFSRQYPEAIARLDKAAAANPMYANAHTTLADAYIHSGAYDSAEAEARKAADIAGRPADIAGILGYLYAASGRRDDALSAVADLAARYEQGEEETAGAVAAIFSALGNADQAFLWLERSLERRELWISYVGVDPKFDPVRGDPRFPKLVAQLGLAR